jgi:hypothetical protein
MDEYRRLTLIRRLNRVTRTSKGKWVEEACQEAAEEIEELRTERDKWKDAWNTLRILAEPRNLP